MEKDRDFRAIIEQAPTLIASKDPRGAYEMVNQRFLEKVQLARAEMIGRTDAEIFPAAFGDILSNGDQQVFNTGVTLGAEHDFSVGGREGIFHCSKFALRQEDGTIRGIGAIYTEISSRAAAEDALPTSEVKALAMLASGRDCIALLDEKGQVVEFNPAAARILGLSREKAIGQNFAELMGSPKIQKAHEECLLGGPDVDQDPPNPRVEVSVPSISGEKILVELSIARLPMKGPPLFRAYLRDITERRAVDLRLRMLESSVFYANDAILITEAEPVSLPGPRIIYINQAFTANTGYTLDEVIGKTPRIVQGPKTDPAATRAIREALENWLAIRIEVINYRKDGTEFWVELNIVPVANANGWFTHWVSIQRETTASHAARIALEEARDEAERATRAKSDFLSRMSHELRTPLNAILGFSQLLQKVPMMPRDRKGLDQIVKAGWHLLDLINDVLDLSRIDSGWSDSFCEPVSIGQMIEESCDLVQPLATAAGIALLGEENVEDWVLADRQHLKQILLNLLSNGIKYNQPGGSVTLACRKVEPDRLCIDICDTGRGIAPENVDKLFRPFERLDAPDGIEGTGLGLVLSQRLTTGMGGSLKVSSTLGIGSTFTIELPRSLPGSRRVFLPEKSIADASVNAHPGKTAVILYIEDNLQNLDLMELTLEPQPGIKLLTAKQGHIGYELAREHLPDLILLDLNLPGIGGYEILRRLRAAPETEKIPVIIVSADASKAQVDQLYAAGASHYITKPYAVPALLKIIDSFLAPGV